MGLGVCKFDLRELFDFPGGIIESVEAIGGIIGSVVEAMGIAGGVNLELPSFLDSEPSAIPLGKGSDRIFGFLGVPLDDCFFDSPELLLSR